MADNDDHPLVVFGIYVLGMILGACLGLGIITMIKYIATGSC